MSATTTAKKGASETGDPLLLTPGPLTTSEVGQGGHGARLGLARRDVPQDQQRGAGAAARDRPRRRGTHVTVPMQGSGTFAVEAMLTTFVPPAGKVLLLINGAYGQRAKKILEIARRARRRARDAGGHAARSRRRSTRCSRRTPRSPMSSSCTARRPAASSIRSTRSARSPQKHGRRFLLDTMSAFGALPLDARAMQVRRDRRVVQQVHRGRAWARLRHLRARRRWPRPRATRRRWCSTCTTSGRTSPRPGSTASRRRSTSSSRSTRR